ncbi:MAG TPA: zf-HC2 domain-containing protein [Candidatus Acidoferrales bacterium]|nr:zf-HC2 domain-containing protein [Candidatus Acidoferrales bacterium]
MNCRQFQDKLFEYVDGTLSASELAAAQRHLSGCSACRKPVQEEQQRAQALSTRLRQSSESLTLRLEILRNILSESRAPRPAATESLAGLWMRRLRLAAVPVSLLLIFAGVLAVHFSGTRTSGPVATHPSAPAPENYQRPEVSIEISYRLPVHKFYQEGNLVVDAFVDETIVVDGAIPSGSLKNHSGKPELKTHL